MFQKLAPEFAEGLALDDDFAGLLDEAIGDLLVQPTIFDMLEYRPPENFGRKLECAFERLRRLNPEAVGHEWIGEAFRDCGDKSMRELLKQRLAQEDAPEKASRVPEPSIAT